jgi:hypothetical protein
MLPSGTPKPCDGNALMLLFPLQFRVKSGRSCVTRTPLFMAIRDGHFEMAQMLISAGADVNMKTTNPSPPFFTT